MKTKKTSLIVPLLFLIIGMGACDIIPRYEIYENHEISACGVVDPLRKLNWLAEFTTKLKRPRFNNDSPYLDWDVRIELYSNIETQEEYIVMFLSPNRQGECGMVYPPGLKPVYSCSGELMFANSSGLINREEWHDFFYSGKNKSQGIIWNRYKIN